MTDTSMTPKLLLSVREAAASLGVSEKSLWSWTVPRGPIRCIRLGNRVLYSPIDLQSWIDSQRKGGAQ